MRPLSLSSSIFVISALASGAFASPGPDIDADEEVLRINPWFKAVRDEAFYRQCQSSCTEFSQGTMTRVELCDDTDICRGKKSTIDEFATDRCREWTTQLEEVTLTGTGRRFKHEPSIGSWISCAIFCETDQNSWYSPRREFGSQAFFPDGVWCHRDEDQDYFCQKNLCLPEGYEITQAVRMAESLIGETEGLESFIIENNIMDETV